MEVQDVRHRFTVEDPHCMGQAGILPEDGRVGLTDGEIVMMTPVCSPQAGKVNRLSPLFAARLRGRTIVIGQDPIVPPPDSEPQLDLAILRLRADFYERSHPGPEDIILIIEASDTSLDSDRTVKLPLYAWAGIREVWIVSLTAECVEVYREPVVRAYRSVQRLTRGQSPAPKLSPISASL